MALGRHAVACGPVNVQRGRVHASFHLRSCGHVFVALLIILGGREGTPTVAGRVRKGPRHPSSRTGKKAGPSTQARTSSGKWGDVFSYRSLAISGSRHFEVREDAGNLSKDLTTWRQHPPTTDLPQQRIEKL